MNAAQVNLENEKPSEWAKKRSVIKSLNIYQEVLDRYKSMVASIHYDQTALQDTKKTSQPKNMPCLNLQHWGYQWAAHVLKFYLWKVINIFRLHS